jgi:hypothetical protein
MRAAVLSSCFGKLLMWSVTRGGQIPGYQANVRAALERWVRIVFRKAEQSRFEVVFLRSFEELFETNGVLLFSS